MAQITRFAFVKVQSPYALIEVRSPLQVEVGSFEVKFVKVEYPKTKAYRSLVIAVLSAEVSSHHSFVAESLSTSSEGHQTYI